MNFNSYKWHDIYDNVLTKLFTLFFQYDSYDQQLEDEQDYMGLYEAEISKQIHLRNKQRKEWDAMKNKLHAAPSYHRVPENIEKQLEDEKKKKRLSNYRRRRSLRS